MAPGRRIERIAIGNGTELAHQDLQHSSNRAVVSHAGWLSNVRSTGANAKGFILLSETEIAYGNTATATEPQKERIQCGGVK